MESTRPKQSGPSIPGGDYMARKYKKTDVVVDNPPFSILSEILKFYNEKGVRFFLFAPALTVFTREGLRDTYITSWEDITYENGAAVRTSFITNLEDEAVQIRTAPELGKRIREANAENLRAQHKTLPRYTYPDEVITAAMAGKMARYDVELKIMRQDCEMISALDSQKAAGKGIFGKGFLLSEKAAAEKAAAEKAAAEKAAAEKAAAEKAAAEKINADIWELSDREREIIKKLGER